MIYICRLSLESIATTVAMANAALKPAATLLCTVFAIAPRIASGKADSAPFASPPTILRLIPRTTLPI
jgi:hypothetical protein